MIFSLVKKRCMFSYATQIKSTYFERILFVIPAYEFCSCIRVGTPNLAATYKIGPLANPPVPITKSGL